MYSPQKAPKGTDVFGEISQFGTEVKKINILDIIYPQVCGICGKLDKNSLCKKCEIKLRSEAVYGIEDYENTTSYFEKHLYIFLYEGEARNLILNYKFKDKTYIYKTFVNFLRKNEKMCVQIKKYDIIMPVAISRKRERQRGYNQSAIFAKDLAKELKIKYIENVLFKIKDNKPQSTLSKEERMQNVQNIYEIKQKEKIKNKKILLIDDIFTTGSTVNECSKKLKEAGVKEVGILTIAKD